MFKEAEKMFPKELIENVAVVITKSYLDCNESDYVVIIGNSLHKLVCKWANILISRLDQVFLLPIPQRKNAYKIMNSKDAIV